MENEILTKRDDLYRWMVDFIENSDFLKDGHGRILVHDVAEFEPGNGDEEIAKLILQEAAEIEILINTEGD